MPWSAMPHRAWDVEFGGDTASGHQYVLGAQHPHFAIGGSHLHRVGITQHTTPLCMEHPSAHVWQGRYVCGFVVQVVRMWCNAAHYCTSHCMMCIKVGHGSSNMKVSRHHTKAPTQQLHVGGLHDVPIHTVEASDLLGLRVRRVSGGKGSEVDMGERMCVCERRQGAQNCLDWAEVEVPGGANWIHSHITTENIHTHQPQIDALQTCSTLRHTSAHTLANTQAGQGHTHVHTLLATRVAQS